LHNVAHAFFGTHSLQKPAPKSLIISEPCSSLSSPTVHGAPSFRVSTPWLHRMIYFTPSCIPPRRCSPLFAVP
jgi:hypothetical protein